MRVTLKDLVIKATTEPPDNVTYEVTGERVTVGRGEENGVVIPREDYQDYGNAAFSLLLKSVSREHCVLYQRGRRLYVEDTGSNNGTYVSRKKWFSQDRRISKVEALTRLKNGDKLMLGDYDLEVVLE